MKTPMMMTFTTHAAIRRPMVTAEWLAMLPRGTGYYTGWDVACCIGSQHGLRTRCLH
jgi:hypothetical protein